MTVQNVPNPIVHRLSLNPENETRKAKTRIEEIFEEREERAAKRFSAAELEKMAIESENEVARLRGEPPKHKYYGGETMDDEDKRKQEEKQAQQRERLMAQAKALIDSGMEPQQVGQMLMGLTPTGTTPVVSQGMNFKDVMDMVTFIVGKKEADELKDVIAKLDKRIDDIIKSPPAKLDSKPIDPIIFAQQQAETLRIYHETLDALGMIPKPGPPTANGESLPVVQERNRHDEKMEEIKIEREYKRDLVEIIGDVPERVGHGIAGQYAERHNRNSGGRSEFIECTEEGCKTKIYITPSTGSQVTCPKCGAIYARKGDVETNTGA